MSVPGLCRGVDMAVGGSIEWPERNIIGGSPFILCTNIVTNLVLSDALALHS